MLLADQELRELASRTDQLLSGIEALPDPSARERAIEVVQALVQLYGAGLSRIVQRVGQRDDDLLRELSSDELIGHLLILHDLHPLSVEVRVAQALEEVRPYLQSHGGDVELVGIEQGKVLVRLEGSCHGCPSSTMTLKLAIEESIHKHAPELDGVEAVNVSPASQAPNGFVPLASLGERPESRGDRGAWTTLAGPPVQSDGALQSIEVDGVALLFLQLEGTLFAYRDQCSSCGGGLKQGTLHESLLTCPNCGARFDVRQAGRSPDSAMLHLDPVPLLRDGHRVQIAVPAVARR